VAVGVICGLIGIDLKLLDRFLASQFARKGEQVVAANSQAAARGYAVGQGMAKSGQIRIALARTPEAAAHLFLSGAEAVGLGAIAGGCNFISSYPMSPSTGVLTFLAQQAADFGIVVEQAEDEIAAFNMGLGAWYAGGRAMVSTSGGGFSLMCEAMSLAGMTETPMVVHLGQRPGPATGLPTRTEQGDLNLALYAGHGEYPRIILAPGTLQGAFELASKAFELADKYQVPVVLLTDQFLIDSFLNVAELAVPQTQGERYIVETDSGYLRYRLTEDGISPRGIPGLGSGFVCVDSDEHDESGHITEDLKLRTRMVDKRLNKLSAIMNEAIPPELVGAGDYETLLIGWGSTYEVIREAMAGLGRDRLAFLHCSQVYPLHPRVAEYLGRARRRVVIENNATSQFGSLLFQHTGLASHTAILKYSGLPFSVEELERKIGEILTCQQHPLTLMTLILPGVRAAAIFRS
jgi:2-oxoglutarate ferredoxin oxidoreductase subunit alpha